MSMDTVKAIIAQAKAGFLATTDGSRATVRPMGSPTWVGHELWFASAVKSTKVEDIKKKPCVEFCAADSQWRHVRISGLCKVSTDRADRQKFIDLVPSAKDYFKGIDDPNYAVLRIKIEHIRLNTGETTGYTEVKPE